MIQRTLIKIFPMMLGIVLLSGCATSMTNPMSTGHYEKETIADRKTYFSRIWTVEHDGEFCVSGRLVLKGTIGAGIPEYVEVTLVKPDGEVLDAKKVAYFPRTLYGRPGHREGRFRATFAQVPPQGTTIRLSNVN